jgi:hypothetical protein
VQLFRGTELIVTHVRSTKPGQWSTRLEHYPPDKAAYLERTPERCRQLASQVGPTTQGVVAALLAERPLDHLRTVQGILRLQDTVGPQRLEAACARALHCGDPRYRRIKQILNAGLDRQPLAEATPTLAQRDYAFARSASEFFAPGEVVTS